MTVSAVQVDRPLGAGLDPSRSGLPAAPRRSAGQVALTVVLLVVLAGSVWAVEALKINVATFVDGWGLAENFLSRTVPFTFPAAGDLAVMIGQTLAIVVLATVLGFVLSVPMGLLAARNVSPGPVRYVARALIVLGRALPEFIIAVFYVRIFGLGALPGILALGLGSVGMMAKIFADAIEEVDPGPREALRASGAGTWQQITTGILPQLRPQLIATMLHAFDINLRGSVVLGFVGVAGIGMYISTSLETLNYPRGLGLTLVLLVLCLLAELVSGMVRRSILPRHHAVATRTSGIAKWLAPFTVQLPERGWLRGRAPAVAAPAGSAPARPAPAVATSAAGTTAPATLPPTARRISPPWDRDRIRGTAWGVAGLLVLVGSFFGADISVDQLPGGLARAWQTLTLYVPPSTGGILGTLMSSMGETVQMGLAGTLLGLVIAIPFGLLSAHNVAPNAQVAGFFRMVVVTIRAIPGIIVGIAFVVITGLGATAGALALAVGAIGFFSKVIADSLEDVDVRVQDAVRTSGAGSVQVFFAATLRQVAPALAAHTMHQLDTNLRAATGLGVIGAGGIGFYMSNASRVLQYGVVTTCLLLVVSTVLISEGLAIWTRRVVR